MSLYWAEDYFPLTLCEVQVIAGLLYHIYENHKHPSGTLPDILLLQGVIKRNDIYTTYI